MSADTRSKYRDQIAAEVIDLERRLQMAQSAVALAQAEVDLVERQLTEARELLRELEPS